MKQIYNSLFELIYALVYLFIAIYFLKSMETLGGGIVFFVSVGAILSIGKLFFKKLNIANYLLSTFLIMLAAFNLFSQVEMEQGFSKNSYVISIIMILIFWLLLLALLFYPIKINQEKKKYIIFMREIFSRLALSVMFPTGMIFLSYAWFTDRIPLIISKRIMGLSNFIPIYFALALI